MLGFALLGCTSYKNSKDVATVGGAMILGTVVIGGSVVEETDVTLDEAFPTMAVLIATGALVTLLGLGGMVVHGIIPDDDDEPKAAPLPPAPPPDAAVMVNVEDRRRAAWSVFQDARVAGYRSDCPRVAALAARVAELDRGIYDQYFVRDPYVLRCAAPTTTPPPR